MTPDIMERTLLDPLRLANLARLSVSIEDGSVPGYIIEVGVYRGGSAKFLARVNPGREVHVFDTFDGIPTEPWDLDGHNRGDFASDFEDVKTYLSDCPNITIHHGVFPETWPKSLLPIALAHIDVDMEKVAREAIVRLWPILSPGGFLVFDDYGAEACRGVKRAVDEMFGERVVLGPSPQAWVQRVFADSRREE
jgi:O-methyltransferase